MNTRKTVRPLVSLILKSGALLLVLVLASTETNAQENQGDPPARIEATVSVTFSSSSTEICPNCSVDVGVTVTPSSAANQVTFDSDDHNVATVSGAAPTVTVHGSSSRSGFATIFAYYNGSQVASTSVISIADDPITNSNVSAIKDNRITRYVLLPGDYGYTDHEFVDVDVTVCRSGNKWHAVLLDIVGHYSERTRLLPLGTPGDGSPQQGVVQQEIRGPGVDTTESNFCEQLTNLDSLGSYPEPVRWFMIDAIIAHEDVHATHMLPSLQSAASDIQGVIEGISIDYTGQSRSEALTTLVSTPDLAQALRDANAAWESAYAEASKDDHWMTLPGSTKHVAGYAYQAERAVVTPLENKILQYAKDQGWDWQDCPVVSNPDQTYR